MTANNCSFNSRLAWPNQFAGKLADEVHMHLEGRPVPI